MAEIVTAVLFLLEENEETPIHDDVGIVAAASAALIRDKRPKIARYVDTVVPQYLPDQFKPFFRISRETFETLLQHISNVPAMSRRLPEAGRSQINNEKALLMTMWYIGSQETVRSISDRFDVQESTFIGYNRRILKLFTEELSKRFIKLPKNNEHHEITTEFQMRKNFPGTIGAIDGTHIRIKPPVDREADYINRKGYHSITLQAVCREDGRFVDVFCGWPGRVNDARIFRTSPLSQILPALCGPNHIIGDGGYPPSRFLLTPYRDNGHLTAEQRLYNKALSGTRVIIENCFGRLKGRFRRLQHVNMNDIHNIVNVVITSCCLHNICIMNNDDLEDFFEEDIDNDYNINIVNVLQPQNAEGTLKRLLITQQIAAVN